MARRWVRAAAVATSIALVRRRGRWRRVGDHATPGSCAPSWARPGPAADAELAGRIAVAAELDATSARLLETGRDLQRELARIGELDSGVEATLDASGPAAPAVEEQSEVVGAQAYALAIMRACLDGVERALAAAQATSSRRPCSCCGPSSSPAGPRSPAHRRPRGTPSSTPTSPIPSWSPTTGSTSPTPRTAAADRCRWLGDRRWRAAPRRPRPRPAAGVGRARTGPGRRRCCRRYGYWVMYYSVEDRRSRGTCISMAVAFSPAGPFIDRSTSPFLCQSGGRSTRRRSSTPTAHRG